MRPRGLADLEHLDDGWWAGWLSYDLGRQIEELPSLAEDDLGLPPLALGRYEAWLEFDHDRARSSCAATAPASISSRRSEQARPAPRLHLPLERWESSLPRDRYERAVERAIDYIRAGDVFQVNLSQRLGDRMARRPVRALRPPPRNEPRAVHGARAARRRGHRLGLAGTLPRGRGDRIETRPIKGTRPRGHDRAADARLAAELRASAKDRAENVMIVDLARNDLGRVARYGSVAVDGSVRLERHPGVHHLVSTVERAAAAGDRPGRRSCARPFRRDP